MSTYWALNAYQTHKQIIDKINEFHGSLSYSIFSKFQQLSYAKLQLGKWSSMEDEKIQSRHTVCWWSEIKQYLKDI